MGNWVKMFFRESCKSFPFEKGVYSFSGQCLIFEPCHFPTYRDGSVPSAPTERFEGTLPYHILERVEVDSPIVGEKTFFQGHTGDFRRRCYPDGVRSGGQLVDTDGVQHRW